MRKPAWMCATIALSMAWPAHAQQRFAYFLDHFTDANLSVEIPPGTVLIGWSNQAQRSGLVAMGRVTGCSTGLGSPGASKVLWHDSGVPHDLHSLFNTAAPPDLSTPANRQTFARAVLKAACGIVDPENTGGFPSPSDPGVPPAPGMGYVLWAQDIEGPINVPEETAAAILALFWAGREVLGPSMQIIPVPASIIQKTTALAWDLKTVVEGSTGGGSPADNYVKFLNLGATLSAANKTALAANDSIDLLSLLHLCTAEGHPLIDGILAQQYSVTPCLDCSACPTDCESINCDALPGRFSSDTPVFHDTTLPYAILSAHDNPHQLFLAPPAGGCDGIPSAGSPWKSFYRGSMPFQAGVYWNQETIVAHSGFDPTHYLTPTPAPSGGPGGGSSCAADLTHDHHVDARDLAELLANWGHLSTPAPADLDGDLDVGPLDLSILLAHWGACPVGTALPWISVLIAEDPPPGPGDALAAYVQKIQLLAPGLEQIHLRYKPGVTSYQSYAAAIMALRAAYTTPPVFGFHPDNSHGSCSDWGCTTGDCPPDPLNCGPTAPSNWQCVLSKSIEAMNAINAILDRTTSGARLTIFSLEQSSVEDVSTSGTHPCETNWLAQIKAVLGGSSTALPGVTAASPPVKFGNVLPSYGGPEIYGAGGYDFGYPQYYNLGKRLIADWCSLVNAGSPYFPAVSASDCLSSKCDAIPSWMVVDVDSNNAYQVPKIPCFDPLHHAPNVYTYVEPGGSGPSPVVAAAYVSFLLTQYQPISGTVDLGGSQVFLTFSGEPEFLGAPGWTLDNINAFHANLMNNFTTLKQLQPGLFPASGGADPTTLKFAIWNFDEILQSIPLN